jgi:hypothetical protein
MMCGDAADASSGLAGSPAASPHTRIYRLPLPQQPQYIERGQGKPVSPGRGTVASKDAAGPSGGSGAGGEGSRAEMAAEIRVLAIGAHQVTRTIFRQLPEESIVAADGSLEGMPWGRVHFHLQDCESRDHAHVLWQKSGELRQSPLALDIEAAEGLPVHASVAADRYLTAWIREACHGRQEPAPKGELEAENGVDVQAHASAAAVRAVAARDALCQAREAVERPIGPSDMHIYAIAEWRDQNPELAALISRALDAGVVISTSSELEVRLAGERADHAPVDSLRSYETGLRTFLELSRGSALAKQSVARCQMEEATGALDAEVNSWGMDWLEISAAYKEELRSEGDRRRRVRKAWETLTRLPQLFILD